MTSSTIFPPDHLDSLYDDVAHAVLSTSSALVISHHTPDGDAIGSTLALVHLLRALGKRAHPINTSDVPHTFHFLPACGDFTTCLPQHSYDTIFLLDCDQKERTLDPNAPDLLPDSLWEDHRVIVIDHHKRKDSASYEFADIVLRDTRAAAVGEMIFRLAQRTDAPVTRDFAAACYCSLMTDTGSFRYRATSPTTFRIAAELLEFGLDPWEMTSNLYENNPLKRIHLLAHALSTLTLSPCGRLAWITFDQHAVATYTPTPVLLDGIINHVRSIQGVEIAGQLLSSGVDSWDVSLRSRGNLRAVDLIQHMGGYGGRNSASCTFSGSHETLLSSLHTHLPPLP